MRRNDVIGRFGFIVVHSIKRSLEFVLRMFDIAEDSRIKELIFVKDDIS